MIIDWTQETMVTSVISRPTSVIVKLSTIVKICKCRGLHEGYHFIPIAMEVHNTPEHDMNRFIKKCAHLFHNRQLRSHLSLSFCIQFLKKCVSTML